MMRVASTIAKRASPILDKAANNPPILVNFYTINVKNNADDAQWAWRLSSQWGNDSTLAMSGPPRQSVSSIAHFNVNQTGSKTETSEALLILAVDRREHTGTISVGPRACLQRSARLVRGESRRRHRQILMIALAKPSVIHDPLYEVGQL